METEFPRSGMFPPSGMHTPFPKKRKNSSQFSQNRDQFFKVNHQERFVLQ